ncbi:AAA family ATPase [Mucilaginibacter sp. McL0603]|uniref:AAA family ATPase n=1 Tax=Mucilaginibacter sp. McL0603 TaxID=3415670 RepID=UPI003CE74275
MLNKNQPAKSNYYTSVDQLNSLQNKVLPPDKADDELLTIYTAKNWLKRASKQPVPKMLFGKLWFEGELCILFADSNLGKSILGVQIANGISVGYANEPFNIECEAQPVLYCDFELSEKQFEARYSANFEDHYDFSDNFYRAELNPENDIPKGFKNFDEYLYAVLERAIVQTKAKAIVIDNITYLRTETEQAKDALPLMKHLKALKKQYKLSILALAHTPKRDLAKEINRNDLQGSKMLMNFCDSAFTIGESVVDKQVRYIKQIKQRNTDQVYGSDNVIVCQINKPHNFLQYEFNGYGNEMDHLRKQKRGEGYENMNEAVRMREEGLTLREIGDKLGVPFQKVDRMIKAAKLKSTL